MMATIPLYPSGRLQSSHSQNSWIFCNFIVLSNFCTYCFNSDSEIGHPTAWTMAFKNEKSSHLQQWHSLILKSVLIVVHSDMAHSWSSLNKRTSESSLFAAMVRWEHMPCIFCLVLVKLLWNFVHKNDKLCPGISRHNWFYFRSYRFATSFFNYKILSNSSTCTVTMHFITAYYHYQCKHYYYKL